MPTASAGSQSTDDGKESPLAKAVPKKKKERTFLVAMKFT